MGTHQIVKALSAPKSIIFAISAGVLLPNFTSDSPKNIYKEVGAPRTAPLPTNRYKLANCLFDVCCCLSKGCCCSLLSISNVLPSIAP